MSDISWLLLARHQRTLGSSAAWMRILTCTLTDPALDLGKFLADLEWWFERKGISGIEEAHAALIKGYQDETVGNSVINERLRRAKLFHVLILVKIVARRVPLYKKEWTAMTAHLVERASQRLNQAIRV